MTTIDTPSLTPRQADILQYVAAYIDRHGYGPTIREIGDQFGINSPNGVVCHLKSLRRKGYVTWRESHGRTLALVKRQPSADSGDDGTRAVELLRLAWPYLRHTTLATQVQAYFNAVLNEELPCQE